VIVGVRLDRAAESVREDSARLHPELTSLSPFLILFAAVILYELDELGGNPIFRLPALDLVGPSSSLVCTRRVQRPGVFPHGVEQPCS
jgi:hypothetical protein